MAFWGIEVRPGKPYTHVYDSTRGRLRVSQATLGVGKSTGKSIVQCNVGKKSPILLCSLIANVSETCHLELEFEEDDEVVFSVLGERSIHLSGYFVGSGRDTGGNETDSYGEDIADTDSGESDHFANYDSEEEYDSDFIDDGDIEMFPPSPKRKSGVVIEEIFDDEKSANGNGNRRRLKKKNQVSDSDDGNAEPQRQLAVKGNRSTGLESEDEDEDGLPISLSLGSKDAKIAVENARSDEKMTDEDRKRKIDETHHPESAKVSDVSGQSESGDANSEKPKKKKKIKDIKPVDTVSDGAEISEQPKKKKKVKAKKVKTPEEGVPSSQRIDQNNDNVDQDIPLNVDPDEVLGDHSAPESSGKVKKNKNKKRKNEQNKSEHSQKMEEDQSVIELPKDDVKDQDSKKKKKKKQSKDSDKDSRTGEQSTNSVVAEGKDDHKDGARSKTREFPNGLTIEELSMGKPDGKRASPGSKVFVRYVGKLQNGKEFDSSGRKPFSFRLGIGQVIKGWDVGVKGMRVGDKRRLTVPPSMGYGEKGIGEIPGNAWLVFDVELVDVK